MNTIFSFIVILIGGAIILSQGKSYWAHYGVYPDFTGIKWILGPLFIIAGIYSLKRNEKKKKINLICPKCMQPYRYKKKEGQKCLKCKLELLTLEELTKNNK